MSRLTTDPAMDVFPSWSPDGRQIAFVRQWSDHAGRIHVISPLGGPERKVADFDAHFDRVVAFGQLSWTPDGRYIAAARSSTQEAGQSTGIYLIPLRGGEPRLLTPGRAPASDRDPAISPDGRRLAYFACGNCCFGDCDVVTLDLKDEFVATGIPRRLTSVSWQMQGLAWIPGAAELVFGTWHHLWRVRLDSPLPPERLEVAGAGSRSPASVPARDRLVFARWRYEPDIYRVDLTTKERVPVVTSTLADLSPEVSPDGRRIAFCSDRSGRLELWVARVDGSAQQPLTTEMSGLECSPSWSPDGRLVAFSSGNGGERQIWVIDAEGGNLRQITTGTGRRDRPTWSRDGVRIYFSKAGPGGLDLWRIPVGGGQEEQVTSEGGFKGFETADGTSFVYQQVWDRKGSPLRIVPIAGGAPRQLVDCAYGFSVGPQGVYYYPCRPEGPPVPLDRVRSIDVRLIDPSTGRDQMVTTLPDPDYGSLFSGPAMFPDGQTVLYPGIASEGQDLMMIENFR